MKSALLAAVAAIALADAVSPLFAQDSNIKSTPVYSYAGAPANGTSEIDTITIGGTPTGGTFTLTVAGGRTTGPITWSATDATLIANIDAALEALPVIGTGGVTTAAGTVSSGIGTITVTFTGKNARQDFALISGTSSLTGTSPTLAVATTTAGVAATWGAAPTGALLEDTTNGDLYQNISTTANSPTWGLKETGIRTGTAVGGTVTQITSRSTGVTLNKRSGKITTTADSLAAATIATFTVTNSECGVADIPVISKVSGDVDTFAWVNSVAAGSFTVSLYNSHASAADTTAFVFNFRIVKGAID